MAERLIELGEGLEIWKVHVDELQEQSINARVMPSQMFERLEATIGRDGRLEALPFCALTSTGETETIEIVSGHHRARAARSGGVHEIHVIVDVSGLTRDQITAKQLSHNAISGYDEKEMIRRLFEGIGDPDARLEAFIDPAELDMPAPSASTIPAVDLDVKYKTMLITFLPTQADLFEQAVQQILQNVGLDARDELVLADGALYDMWCAALSRVGKEYDARALSTVLTRLIEMLADQLGIETVSAEAIDPEEWVPLATLLGSAVVPPDVANVIRQAVEKMSKAGDVTPRAGWRAVELWAADCIAAP